MVKVVNRYIILCYFASISIYSQPSNTVPKQGGICFRVDDNGLINQFEDYVQIFSKYNQNFTFAMNLGLDEFDSQFYIDKIIEYQSMGNELMDHTPNHRTNYFVTKFDTNDYKNQIGVDHVIDSKICLQHETADTSLAEQSDTATISTDTVFFSDRNYSDINKNDDTYIYFPSLNQMVLISKYRNKQGHFTDLWDDSVDLGNHKGIRYYIFNKSKINLTNDAITLLAGETKKLANLYGLIPPKAWVQPGGNFLEFDANEIKNPLESLGYTSGATYPNPAEKVYDEYNPEGDRQFAMQWGDFIEDDQTFETIKEIIADGIAKHKILIGNSHWYSGNPADWNNYIEKVDSILSWATRNSIPVKTYTEWSDLLYYQTPDPYYNIIPPLNVDKDLNGIPDGYTDVFYQGDVNGSFVIDSTTPGPGANYYSIETDQLWDNKITYIEGLGGFEKGKNDFSIWTKGAPGDSVKVVFAEPYPSNISVSFKFPAETLDWQKHSLSQQGKSLVVNENQSVLDIEFYCSDYVSGTVKIAGMYLAKKIPKVILDLKVFLEGSYSGGGQMKSNSEFFSSIPLKQPYNNAPWNYDGTDSVSAIPPGVIDWVLIELRDGADASTEIAKKTGFVKDDGKVVATDGLNNIVFEGVPEGDYYIVVYHRNHLSIMSSQKIHFSSI